MTSLSNDKSTHISHILDNIGLSTAMVAMRILSNVYKHNIENTIKEPTQSILIPSGSVIEGIGLQWYPEHLKSDVDTMVYNPYIVVHDGKVGPRPSRN
jgi:hypothetical protein